MTVNLFSLKRNIIKSKLVTNLPQGLSSVVLRLKVFSKLYRLCTSSFSVPSAMQPLKYGFSSGGGG